ncbi:MAG: hypothetical protein ACFE9S_17215, partial [Candidatus Hermodarchaeota archaeon]
MSKINLVDKIDEIPKLSLGIDMGQTLSKLAYLKGEQLVLTTFPTQIEVSSLKTNLKSKEKQFTTFNFTGGKSYYLFREYSKKCTSNLINEFEANVSGVKFL